MRAWQQWYLESLHGATPNHAKMYHYVHMARAR